MARPRFTTEPCRCGEPSAILGLCKRCYAADYRNKRGVELLEQKRTWYREHRDRVSANARTPEHRRKKRELVAKLTQQGRCSSCARAIDARLLEKSRQRQIGVLYCGPCRLSKNETGRRLNRRLRLSAVEALGGRCAACGFPDARALHIDHVHGGGRDDRSGLHPHAFLRRVVELATSGLYQLLCANCNAIKKHEQREVGGPRVWIDE